jgi:hypothetical protein
METLVWTQGSDGVTAEKVVADFARRNWKRPRESGKLRDGQFWISGEADLYRVRLEPGGVWAIYRQGGDQDPHPLD